jgi:P27 family predicted phage terminase small subunit
LESGLAKYRRAATRAESRNYLGKNRMTAGRPPKPTRLKVVAGNPGRRPLNFNEPNPGRIKLRAPNHLSEAGQKAWRRMAAMLDRLGVLTEADVAAFESLCEAYADLWEAREKLAERRGLSYRKHNDKTGITSYHAYPEIAIIADADRRLRAWLGAFGMTPSDRSRVTLSEKREPNALDKFLKPPGRYF